MILFNKILASRWLLGLLLISFTISGFGIALVLGEDPGFGLSVWNDMANGGPFNQLAIPSPTDISQHRDLFLTWWTPGQYAVPGVVSQLFGISTGVASIWVTLLFSVVGLIGWHFVYRELGFEQVTIGLCLFFITTSRLFTINFLNYTGGELLLFGSQPWTIWYYLKYRSSPLKLFGGLLALSLVSFFLKSAYTIGFAALGGCAGLAFLIDVAKTRKLIIPSLMTVAVVGVCIFCYLALTQFGFIALGTSPITSTSQPFKMVWSSFETLTYPLTHWFSIAEIYPQLLQRIQFPQWGHGVYYALMFVGFGAMIQVTLETRFATARNLFIGFYIVYCGVFLLLYNKGADISIEYRHTKVVAYLFLPLLITALQQPSTRYYRQGLMGLLLLLNTGYGLVTFVLKKQEIAQESATGTAGFALRHASTDDLAFIHSVDKPDNILYFTSGSMNVDAFHARKLVGSIDYKFARGCGFIFDKYEGKAGPVYAFVHEAYAQLPTNPTLEAQFPRYTFRLVKQTKKFKIYEGK